jgi:hypothetical protein
VNDFKNNNKPPLCLSNVQQALTYPQAKSQPTTVTFNQHNNGSPVLDFIGGDRLPAVGDSCDRGLPLPN